MGDHDGRSMTIVDGTFMTAVVAAVVAAVRLHGDKPVSKHIVRLLYCFVMVKHCGSGAEVMFGKRAYMARHCAAGGGTLFFFMFYANGVTLWRSRITIFS